MKALHSRHQKELSSSQPRHAVAWGVQGARLRVPREMRARTTQRCCGEGGARRARPGPEGRWGTWASPMGHAGVLAWVLWDCQGSTVAWPGMTWR